MDENTNEEQGSGIASPRPADQSWARMQPVAVMVDPGRLKAPSTKVSMTNTHAAQTHIMVDKNMVGHELKPGQTIKDVDMVDTDIEHFQSLRKPGRFDRFGNKLNQHPVTFDVTAREPAPQQQSSGGGGGNGDTGRSASGASGSGGRAR